MKSGVRYSAAFPDLTGSEVAATAANGRFWAAVYDDKTSLCGALHSYDPAADKWTTHVTRPSDKRLCVGTLGAVDNEVFLRTSLQERSVSIN